jgi:hypothetical protein
MKSIQPLIPVPNRPATLLPAALACACCLFASCDREAPADEPEPVRVTDTEPVGDGLKVIGFALLGAAVVTAIGRLAR